MVEDTRLIRIATDDRTFLSDLQAARIEGLKVSRRLQASGAEQGLPFLLAAEIVRDIALPLFVAWLYDRVVKRKRGQTTIDGVEIPDDVEQLTILVHGDEVSQKPQRRPTQKNKKQGAHQGSSTGAKGKKQ